MKQPRSMLCRKLERNYIAENDTPNDDRDFDYNFLPYCFTDKGFRPSPLLNFSLHINGDSKGDVKFL